ncbi:DUF1192 domain-containing protein [Rhizobium sp.]
MSLFEDDRPKKKTSHEIGVDLSLLSVDELRQRVGILKDEIARLETEITAKSSSRNAAEGLFKK